MRIMKIYWAEKLSFVDVLFFGIKGLLNNISIYYDENKMDASANTAIRLFKRLKLTTDFFPANLFFGRKDSDGYSLSYRMQDDLIACQNRFCETYLIGKPSWLINMVKQYIADNLYYRFMFISMVEECNEFKASKENGYSGIFYISRHPLNPILKPYFEEKGYTFRESLFSSEAIKYFLRPLYHLLCIFGARLRFSKIATNIKETKPSIWIEYCHFLFQDFAFWREELDLDRIDIVYYADREDDPHQSVFSDEVEGRGLKWIDLHFNKLTRLASLNSSDIKQLLCNFFEREPCSSFWFKVFKFEHDMWFLLYRSVFRRFKVKILIQHRETSWVQEPQAKAIEAAGGIMVGFHWSNYPFYKQPFLNPMHILFVWGKFIHDCIQKKGNSCYHILPSGLWLLPNDEARRDSRLFSEDINFVISIFDNTISYNSCFSFDTLKVFYDKVLALLYENKHWGGIVKSKGWNYSTFSLIFKDTELFFKIQELIDDKRLVFLDYLLHPSAAFEKADLSVCYGVNSAGIIAGIYGYRNIHWDAGGFLNFPIYKDKNQKILYPKLSDFLEAITKVGIDNDREIGDFSRWRKDFNHFDDFLAKKRVGRIIKAFMESPALDKKIEDILTPLVNEYVIENKIDKRFFETSNRWDN